MSLIHSFLLLLNHRNHWCFYFPNSFSFLIMPHIWNYIVYKIFRLIFSYSNIYFNVSPCILWVITYFFLFPLYLCTTLGREQMSQDGLFRLFQTIFVNNDYVTIKIIYSTVHVCHEVPTWLQASLCWTHVWVPPRKWQHYCCIMAGSIGSVMRGENIVWLLLQLLCQPVENTVMATVSARREVVLC